MATTPTRPKAHNSPHYKCPFMLHLKPLQANISNNPSTMSTSFEAKMPSVSSLFTAYATLSAFVYLLRSIFKDIIPDSVKNYLNELFERILKLRSSKLTLVIEEVNVNHNIVSNELYDAAELYLSTKITTPSTNRLKISKSSKDKNLTTRFENGELIDDSFEGIALQWCFRHVEIVKGRSSIESKYFELTFDKEQNEYIKKNYIPYILSKYKTIQDENKTLKLCTLNPRSYDDHHKWKKINLDHPSTFDTLAMDPEVKFAIKADLDRFVRRRGFYKRVGKAWKRGYLLYGPPGTGKSSLVAAMANYLNFNVYDLQLESSITDADLRLLFVGMANRSILAIEDIDCTVDIKNRASNKDVSKENDQKPPKKLTLSGLLNFIDGLWSSCGDERIIIFTTNHKEKLDPALLRPGRMDMHIHMSYLTVQGFKLLVTNYLEIDGTCHRLFGEIERLIESVNVSPAQVAEELMRSEDVDEALEGVAKLLAEIQKLENSKEECKKDEGQNGHFVGEIEEIS